VRLTDVTVREAAQMPGRSYAVDQRVEAGLAIDRLGVDRIQTGFPVAGEVEQAVTRELSASVDADTVAIARALERDVEAALDAGADVIEVFAPVADRHIEYDLGKSREEVLDMLTSAVDRAADGGATVRVAVLDGFRTADEHLIAVFDRFDHVSAIGLADTVGRRSPRTVRETLTRLADHVDPARISVHFHNDLGVGTANVLAAYECGVGNADVSVAALGERVGNPALEEVVAVGDLEYDEPFGVDPERLVPVAEEVLEALGEPVSDRKPILGSAATTHEAGLHTAAMLDEPSLYEPFDPARFGGRRTLVFGEGTGRGAARKLLQRADVAVTDERVERFMGLLEADGPMDQVAAVDLAERTFG
jgi:isopropylmalate/homocitrate/citramalate synthase